MAGNAVISECGSYRYALYRDLDPVQNTLDRDDDRECGETCLFVVLNPSTADAERDDPTIRRCMAFARSWGFVRLAVANLYAYRATDPAELRTVGDPVGPDNDGWIATLANEADFAVAAWGASLPDPEREKEVTWMLDHDYGVVCLGLTQDGHPRHPLYVPANTEPVDFSLPALPVEEER